MIIIPLDNAEGYPLKEVSFAVDGVEIKARLDWNETSARWGITLLDPATDAVMVTAPAVISNFPLFRRRQVTGMPPGVFLFWREFGEDPPGLFDLDDTIVQFQYLTAEDYALATV